MKTSDIPHVAKYLMEKHGVLQQGWKFQWDNAKRRAGQCRYLDRVITLSHYYVTLNVADRFDDVYDTILHEIAHAMVGPGIHHGPKWQETAIQAVLQRRSSHASR